jgi:glycerol-3-phosphate acyltransferase PlsY
MSVALALAVSYLVGAIPWSWLAGRWFGGVDLRRVGSGNLGATNAFRVLGARVAIPVLCLDIAKGTAAPTLWARLIGAGPLAPATAATLCGLAAILGHMFPVYLGFRGGKGIATSAGVFAALEPVACLIAVAVFALAFAVSGGIVSVGSLLGSLALPVAMLCIRRSELDGVRFALVLALVVLVWIKHAANIARLVRGQESRLWRRRANSRPAPPPGAGPDAPGGERVAREEGA